jgi:hypothetical protein
VRRLIGLCVVAGALLLTGASCDPADPSTWSHAAQVALSPEQAETPDVQDYTGEIASILYELYTTTEIQAAHGLAINWSPTVSMTPYTPNSFPECMGGQRCFLIDQTWWTSSGWPDQEGANRVMTAHEFAHVLSLERKETDLPYAKAVNRVDEECLADAVAAHVLARGGFPPPVTDGYQVAYLCEEFWQDAYGESRQAEADALAADLLHWAVTGQVVEITGPASATEGAEREYVYQW